MCGWLKDKYGLSWQIVPAELGKLMSSKEPGKAKRVMTALLKMKKLDIETLRNA
jgi:predicted 3-demethylubiquinone-9 3-methyltransferase (glyoxalase superfamily)